MKDQLQKKLADKEPGKSSSTGKLNKPDI